MFVASFVIILALSRYCIITMCMAHNFKLHTFRSDDIKIPMCAVRSTPRFIRRLRSVANLMCVTRARCMLVSRVRYVKSQNPGIKPCKFGNYRLRRVKFVSWRYVIQTRRKRVKWIYIESLLAYFSHRFAISSTIS